MDAFSETIRKFLDLTYGLVDSEPKLPLLFESSMRQHQIGEIHELLQHFIKQNLDIVVIPTIPTVVERLCVPMSLL